MLSIVGYSGLTGKLAGLPEAPCRHGKTAPIPHKKERVRSSAHPPYERGSPKG
jgi:hypothetical protein